MPTADKPRLVIDNDAYVRFWQKLTIPFHRKVNIGSHLINPTNYASGRNRYIRNRQPVNMPQITVPTGGYNTQWKEGGYERYRKLSSKLTMTMVLIFALPAIPMFFATEEGPLQPLAELLCLPSFIPMLYFQRIFNHYYRKMEDCKEATQYHYITGNTSRRGWWKW